jgi:hypothetical protein
MSKRSIFITFGIVIVALIAAGSVSSFQRELELQKDEARSQASYNQILEGAQTTPTKLAVSYKTSTKTASPLLFGGAHTPLDSHKDAWNKIEDVGVTMIRRDFFMEQILPADITVDDYRSNKNDIQNPENWNKDMINNAKFRYQEAHKRGMKTMGIVDYAPAWLTYSHTPFGMPTDWSVYEDLVKKLYTIYRDDIDYLEIWNEPSYSRFMDVSNSNRTMEEIYVDIAKHTIKAVREVDKEKNDGKIIPLGGLVADNPIYAGKMLEAILKEPEIMHEIAFISYHTYGHPEPSSNLYRGILKDNGYPNMPMYVTEWNFSSDEKVQQSEKIGNKAITYTANQFLTYIDQNIAGANYYMLEPVDYDTPGIGKKYMGFYKWEGGEAILLPQARTWRLFSVKMGMGEGESKIYPVKKEKLDLNTIGFTNSKGQNGLIAVNDSRDSQMTSVHLTDLDIKRFARVQIYNASAGNDATKPVFDGRMKVANGSLDLNIYLPAEGIAGVIITKEKEWYDFLNILN